MSAWVTRAKAAMLPAKSYDHFAPSIVAAPSGPVYDYRRQVWLDARTLRVLPCRHPVTMGPRCCNARVILGR
jgi:hypothetical protein